ncbi:MAG: hypothetical protein QOK10_1362 [Pseudonocardiales bacterium]|jgi:DNA-binding NarL/FixJ family response regulator|nr:hypothetical protein [Pseudonocardiales bacterium]
MDAGTGERTAITVFVAGGHELTRRGIAALIADEADLVLAGQGAFGPHLLTRIASGRPDVVVIGMGASSQDGVQLCHDVRTRLPDSACILMTEPSDTSGSRVAGNAGAAACLPTTVPAATFLRALRGVARGDKIRRYDDVRVPERQSGRLANPRTSLTEQERRIFALIGQGKTNHEIAVSLVIAEKTVKNHVTAILSKLNLTSRTQAAILASGSTEP